MSRRPGHRPPGQQHGEADQGGFGTPERTIPALTGYMARLGSAIPALKRAFDENAKGRPAFVEFICSHHPVHGGWVR